MIADLRIEPMGHDLVAMSRCYVLDASLFPHPSLPLVSGAVTAVWIAKRGDAIVGFAGTQSNGVDRDITGIAVAETERGRGVGRALVRAVIEASTRLRALSLNVSTGNVAAIGLYESEGFSIVRTVRRYYSPARFPNGGDAHVMKRRSRR